MLLSFEKKLLLIEYSHANVNSVNRNINTKICCNINKIYTYKMVFLSVGSDSFQKEFMISKSRTRIINFGTRRKCSHCLRRLVLDIKQKKVKQAYHWSCTRLLFGLHWKACYCSVSFRLWLRCHVKLVTESLMEGKRQYFCKRTCLIGCNIFEWRSVSFNFITPWIFSAIKKIQFGRLMQMVKVTGFIKQIFLELQLKL